ncbi:MAG TPA: hypothetical protein VGS04_08225, partial [Nitrososphaerales archaeon]|nr:hypothetical protein [Nitrososphaerales archaeon]
MSTQTLKLPAVGAVMSLLVMALAATIPAASAQTGPGCTSITSDFNGTSIAEGNWIWFNAHIDLKSPASDGLTVYFTQQTITFSWGSVAVPDGEIVYSSSVSSASTTYYAGGTGPNPPADGSDYWYTLVPVSQGGDIFISGLAYKVTQPAGTNYNPVAWSGCFSVSGSTSCAFSLQWQWGAAVYTTFASPAPGTNNLGVTSTQANGLQSGTPTNYEQYVIGGARGGGGANYTGSWSGTASVSTTCYCSNNSCSTTPPPPPPTCSSSSSATLTVNSVTLSGAPLGGMEMDVSDCMGNPYASTFTSGGITLGTGAT